jgi:hypothetical protein
MRPGARDRGRPRRHRLDARRMAGLNALTDGSAVPPTRSDLRVLRGPASTRRRSAADLIH